MKLSLTGLLSFLLGCKAVPFKDSYHYPYEPFGVVCRSHEMDADDITKVAYTSRKTNPEPKEVDVDPTLDYSTDFNQAEDAIFHAVETAEKAVLHLVEHAVEDEVDTLFHDLPKHKRAEEGEEKEEKKRRCIRDDVRECLEAMEHGDME